METRIVWVDIRSSLSPLTRSSPEIHGKHLFWRQGSLNGQREWWEKQRKNTVYHLKRHSTYMCLYCTRGPVHGLMHMEKKLVRRWPVGAGLGETGWTLPGTNLLWSLPSRPHLGQLQGLKGICKVSEVPPAGGVPWPGL